MFIPGAAGSVPLRRVLHVGLIGEVIRELQGLLNAITDAGSPPGRSRLPELEQDGEFGSRTMMRVKEFPSRNNPAADGVIGPQTDARIDAVRLDFLGRGSAKSSSDAAQQ